MPALQQSSAQQGQFQGQANQNQGQRQDAANQNQAQRQGTASQNQAARQGNYYGSSGGCGNNCSNWDSGDAAAGLAVGALVGGAVVAGHEPASHDDSRRTSARAARQLPRPPPHPVAPPCNVAPIPVSGVPYYKCGPTWYTAGYGSMGVVYMPVPPPPGY